jgi:hypothetical protein
VGFSHRYLWISVRLIGGRWEDHTYGDLGARVDNYDVDEAEFFLKMGSGGCEGVFGGYVALNGDD